MRVLILCITLLWTVTSSARELTDLRTFGQPSKNEIYLFTSPNCPHCRDFHKSIFPELIKRYINTQRAQLFIVDMPYDTNSLHAAMLLRCLDGDKANRMTSWLYETQGNWVDLQNPDPMFLNYLKQYGVTSEEFNTCLSNETLKNTLIQQRDNLSNLYQVRGWPTTVLRKGHIVRHYVGANKQSILNDLEQDLKDFEQQ